MRRHVGQAVRATLRTSHVLARVVLALTLVALLAVSALAWRLSRGPLDLPWLVRRLEASLNTGPGAPHWTITNAALAWEGFSAGIDRPLDIRIDGLVVTGPDGHVRARVPQARVSLSLLQLLRQRLVPRAVELDGVRLRVLRGADGGLRVDLGTEATDLAADLPTGFDLLAMLARPLQTDLQGGDALLSQLRRIRVRDGGLLVVDRQAETVWHASGLVADLRRGNGGGADGTLAFEVGAGTQQAHVTASVALRDQPDYLAIRANVSDLNPARLAIDIPRLAVLAPLDAPLAVTLQATLDHKLDLRQGTLTARLGSGRVALAHGFLPVDGGGATLSGDLAAMTITDLHLETSAPGVDPVRLTGSGKVARDDAGYDAKLSFATARIGFAGLDALWPDGLGGPGTKPWITENITAGQATDLQLGLDLHAPPDVSNVSLTGISGGFDADGLTVHWLRPVPPIEQGRARVTFVSPDVLDVTILSGHQGALQVTGGRVRFSGLAARDQVADITANINGPVADVLALLRHPRIHLLDKHPIETRNPAGQVTAQVTVTALPLETSATMDDVRIDTTAHFTGLHLGGIAAGHDLDQGTLDLQASNDGLKLTGDAQLGGIPTKLQVDMDFRPGPPSQVVQTVTASGSPTPAQLTALGLGVGDIIQGAAPASLVWHTRRDGQGDLAVKADLGPATLSFPDLSFTKPPGKPAQLEAHLQLSSERITALDRLILRGDGIDADAKVDFAAGKPSLAQISRLVLGTGPDPRATDLHGTVRFPATAGAPWQISLAGPSIDASSRFARADTTKPKPPETKGPPYVLDATFARVLLGPGRSLADVNLQADNDGWINRSLHLSGRSAKPFSIDVTPAPGGRTLGGSSTDAGGLLRALNIVADMQGGTIRLTGRYDDTQPGHPLAGTAEITDFRMANTPGLIKLLQAMTLYGLVEMARGPGLGFTRLEAPFRLTGDNLELNDARAFNASLGMTAKGNIDLARQRCDIGGTIVPAYFFNSLLGNIPLVGRLFSAEKGGGLFAANYTLSGDCGDPAVGVNPLSALTPGFLRGIFGLFEGGPSGTPSAPANPPAGR